MTRSEFIRINDQPCRIRLKSGREVYGVIREKINDNKEEYYFSSLRERYGKTANSDNNLGMMINLDDVVGAEILPSVDVLVG
ncbi:MAG: hypothetical protein Fur0041_00990 [Bacteroidia bacterium]